MSTTERVERARMNMHLCWKTETGKRYVATRFTLLALLIGAPDTYTWEQFGAAFEKAFGLTADELTMTDVDMWRGFYERWYAKETK